MNESGDIRHMRHALRLAARGLGLVAPNPAVGCVLVAKNGTIVGRGWTAPGGRPHAETRALAQAGAAAKGATAYVTLEPCAHYGQTPPCARALGEARIARAVVALRDPDPRVNGKGLAMLREARIAVTEGVCAAEAEALNAGFLFKVREGRPLVTLKMAMSLDGKIAAASGESRWITGPGARAFGHLLRARHDAILVGLGTVRADNPALTCRLPGMSGRSPLRVVLDSRLELPATAKLLTTSDAVPTLIFTAAPQPRKLPETVEIVTVPRDPRGRPDLAAVLHALAQRGVTRLLVEGGAGVHASFLDRGFADRLEIFRAPMLLGGGGFDGIDALAAHALGEAPRFEFLQRRRLGSDVLESFVRAGYPECPSGSSLNAGL